MSDPTGERRNTIRFGIMCTGTRFQAWQAKCLQKLLALEHVEPALLIIDDDALRHGGLLQNARKLKNLGRLAWYLFSLLERGISRAMRPVDMNERLAGIPSLRCAVLRKGKYSEYFREDDIAEIRRYDLDFILRFGFNIIRGEILSVPRYGVWSFHHDDEQKYRGGPPGFWEMYNGDCVTGAILQRLTDSLDAGIVLKKGYRKTILTSYTHSRDGMFLDSADWPAQVCADLQRGDCSYLNNAPSETTARIFRTPGNAQMLVFLLKLFKNNLGELSKKLFVADKWNIGVVNEPITRFLETGPAPDVTWMPPPERGRFFADPFALSRDNVLHILLEDYSYAASKGRISSFSIDGENIAGPRAVLDESWHMSHPYIVEYAGSIYCIPETCDAREVALYRAGGFPENWAKVATLIGDFAGVDTTVVEYRDRWWLFATDQDDGPNHKLRIFFAPKLTGPWERHFLNPAKIDVRSSRPAGTPFMHHGALIRPSQDCSEYYGRRIVLNRITKLTPYEFEEEYAGTIEPYETGPYAHGTHTVSAAAGVTVIDGMKKVFVGGDPAMVVHKLRRIFTSSGH